MEIKQSRNSNRTRFEFGEDELNYTLEDGSGSRSFSVQHTEITSNRQTLEERNQWLRNVGLRIGRSHRAAMQLERHYSGRAGCE